MNEISEAETRRLLEELQLEHRIRESLDCTVASLRAENETLRGIIRFPCCGSDYDPALPVDGIEQHSIDCSLRAENERLRNQLEFEERGNMAANAHLKAAEAENERLTKSLADAEQSAHKWMIDYGMLAKSKAAEVERLTKERDTLVVVCAAWVDVVRHSDAQPDDRDGRGFDQWALEQARLAEHARSITRKTESELSRLRTEHQERGKDK